MTIILKSPKITPQEKAKNIIDSLCVMPNLIVEVDDERVLKEIVNYLKGPGKLCRATDIKFTRQEEKRNIEYSLDEMAIAMKQEFAVFPKSYYESA